MKILILKPSSLGDVIHALPVLRLLKLHYRDAKIFWWIDSALAPLIEGDPDLAGIVRFERGERSLGTREIDALGLAVLARHFNLNPPEKSP